MERKLLEELRIALAKSAKIATYSIFHDEELDLLMKKKPKTLKELEGLKGFPKGGARCTKWGEAIVAIFNQEGIEKFSVDASGVCKAIKIRKSSSF